MLGPDPFLFQGGALFRSLPSLSDSLLAYGPAPGVELITYFLALAAWAGLAFLSLLLAPFTALLRRLRRSKSAPATEPKPDARIVSQPESSGEDNRDGT